jgi:hypothetical protein
MPRKSSGGIQMHINSWQLVVRFHRLTRLRHVAHTLQKRARLL